MPEEPEITIMSPEMAATTTMQGWLVGLIETGYEKTQEFSTAKGGTVVVFQNIKVGKICILVKMAEKEEWLGLYPLCGFWDGMYSNAEVGPTTWHSRTPKQLRDDFVKASNGTRRDAAGKKEAPDATGE